MMNRTMTLILVGALCFGCGGGNADSTTPPPDTAPEPDTTEPDTAPPVVCNPGSQWVAGTSAFQNATEKWGLLGVEGIRFSVTDIDNDGWADVFVRLGGGDDFGPDGNRGRWALRNTGNGTFEDVTQSSGVVTPRIAGDPNVARPGQVFASGDVDNDGDLDVFTGTSRTDPSAGGETCELMLNNGDGTFVLGPEDSDARFVNVPANPAGTVFVDVDRDGLLDLWIVNNELPGWVAMPDHLLKGDGTGRFTDISLTSGMTTYPWHYIHYINNGLAHSWGWSGAACDLNNDGLPELLASSYGRAPNHLWRSSAKPNGGLLYVNESVASGYAFDGNQDWTDNLSAQCYCEDNPTEEDCELAPTPASAELCALFKQAFGPSYRWHHATSREPFNLGGNSGSTLCADVDNDGDMDLLTTEIVHWDVGTNSDPSELLVNTGDPLVRFQRPSNAITGLTRVQKYDAWNDGDMTAAVFDFDNDGWPDIYIGASDYPGNKALLYHQDEPLRFTRLETPDYFEHFRANGMAVADFDRDGDLDMLVGHALMRCGDGSGEGDEECGENSQIQFFENTMGAESNWLQLQLEGGDGSNRMAIGARVSVTAGGITQTQEIGGGHGQYGYQRDRVLHFGLATACEAQVTITWPNANQTSQTFAIVGNERYVVVQGEEPTVAPR